MAERQLIANCIMIAQFPIENHSEQGQFAEVPLKTIGKVQSLGDYYAIRSSSRSFCPSMNVLRAMNIKTRNKRPV